MIVELAYCRVSFTVYLVKFVCIKARRTEDYVRLELSKSWKDLLGKLLSPILRSHLAYFDRYVEYASGVDFIGFGRVFDYIASSWVKRVFELLRRAATAAYLIVKQMH